MGGADYMVQSRLRDGTYVATLPFRNLQWEHGINGPYGARFDLPLHHDAVSIATMEVGLHEIWIFRNGVQVFAGPLWDAVPSSQEASISCGAMSLEDYFDVRLVGNQTYSVVDQVNIAWGYINASQLLTGGGLGIVAGTLNTGITRSVKWTQYDVKYILEAIQDLSDLTQGFDFKIDPATRQFNAYWPRLQRNNNLTLTYPYHIRRHTVQYMGKYVRNSIVVQGVDPQVSVAVDTTSRTKYGLREYADNFRDAPTVTDLSNYASRVRDLRANPKQYPTIILNSDLIDIFDPNVIKLGDLVGLVINDGYTQFSQTMRYHGGQISVDKQGGESISLYFQDQRELN